MKKFILLAISFIMTSFITGCSWTSKGSESSSSPSNVVKEAKDIVGEETQFGTPLVSLKLSNGKIVEIKIDEITTQGSKKDLKEDYEISEDAVAPWYKQIESLENYILKNGVDTLELKEGKVVNEDLRSSVTINVEGYIKTIQEAINQAK